MRSSGAVLLFGLFIAATRGQGQEQHPLTAGQSSRPNVVFVLTDDQDLQLDSLQYMPLVKKHLIDQGTFFNKHFCTTALCCPSRVTLWTGKAAHNTNITDVNPPYGGYPRFVEQGFNEDWFPVWLQKAGYNTYYTGKLFNAHTVDNWNSPHPAGFTGSDFLLDPYTYNYMNSTFQRHGEEPRSYEGGHLSDVITKKAYGLLDDAVHASKDKPFFLAVAPVAPHANVEMRGKHGAKDRFVQFTEPIPLEKHRHMFKNVTVPRTANFNPDQPSGASWLLDLPQQNQSNVEYNDHFYRQRLRALQSVDEIVDGLVSRLEGYSLLDNTYIVYSSDNGFHIGQHRLQPGKSCGYEEDINVPLIVRGPGVAANYTTNIVTTHTDLAPTFFDLLGIPLRDDFDGRAIPMTRPGIEHSALARREHASIEFWGKAFGEGIHHPEVHWQNTYKALRISGPGYNLYYSVWCNNEHELYDMDADPAQMDNLLASTAASEKLMAKRPLPAVLSRLDALLLVMKTCAGATCRAPWRQLHPFGDVDSLADAISPEFDPYYDTLPRVEFDFCADGYLPGAEGPAWGSQGVPYLRDGARWEDWV
ncbi:arylsulfatase [Xylariomycetidae sp. FL0641]|nr:arylsulfatase [Xylariomycetidae sp. FL0641]